MAVGDGTTLMPDTAANQSVWPQRSGQNIVWIPNDEAARTFFFSHGAAHALVTGTLHDAEQSLFPSLWRTLTREFDLLLGDRAFGSFARFGALRQCGLHGVFRLHQKRKVNWNKPPNLVWWLPGSAPDSIAVCILRVCMPIAGFRTRVLFIVADLLDPKQFPASDLAELYRRRWHVRDAYGNLAKTQQ